MSTTSPSPDPEMLHTTITGHEIRLRPTLAEASFLDQLRAMLADPEAHEREMVGLGYSRANPLLCPPPGDPAGDRGYVTAEVLAHPVYRVMADLITRKRLAETGTDPEALAAEYTLTVPETARQLGVTEGAVRKAIDSGRLASWVKAGRNHLHPRGVEAWGLSLAADRATGSKRGPRSARELVAAGRLVARVGHGPGWSLVVKHPLHELADVQRVEGNVVEGVIPAWKRVAVLARDEDGQHLYVIEPAETEQTLTFHEGFVRGRFEVVERAHGQKAREAFKAFEPA